ncbi:MAG: triose-phosphate isomerase [Syntrophomonadaceae bacterium]|jgi:triosephosphate isomerase
MVVLRKYLVVANWKMNKNTNEAHSFGAELKKLLKDVSAVEVVICPPFTALSTVKSILHDSRIKIGAQNVFWQQEGAYTGEISPAMLTDVGCEYVIIGHSERRQIIGETDQDINNKIMAARAQGLIPILCVGETLQERNQQKAEEVVKRQLCNGLKGVELSGEELVIAYEPVWAIGTGVNAKSQDAQEMAKYIRKLLEELYNGKCAEKVRILYGGSVKAENFLSFIHEEDIDGALVGGASLWPDSFAQIVRLCANG